MRCPSSAMWWIGCSSTAVTPSERRYSVAGSEPRHIAVPVEKRVLGHLDPALVPDLVEEAELDALGVLREEREVRAAAVPGWAEREGTSGPHLHQRISTVRFAKSATSSRS